MSILKTIAIKLKGHNCEKMVKRIGNEISLTLPTVDVGVAKINMGLFSNKIVELVRASNIATSLDTSQYHICKTKSSTSDPILKVNCEKIQLQIVLALTQLESIFESIKIDPSPEMRKELVDWIKYCSSLNKHAIEAVSPGTSGKGPGDYDIEDIMKYQKITEDEMYEAVKELQNSNENAIVRLGKLFSKFDRENNYSELIATISNKPVNTQFEPKVIAQIEDGQVVFRSSKFKDQELNRITMNDLRSVMDSKQLLIFEAYTSSLNKNLEEWRDTKSKGKLDTDPEIREIAKRICSNWGEIMELLGTIKFKILDHYGDLWMVCRNSGMLIDKTRSDL